MRILVLGAAGFIGSNLMKRLGLKGHAVIGVDIVDSIFAEYSYYRFNGDLASWQEILEAVKPEACINAAGSSDVVGSLHDPESDFSRNVKDTSVFLEGIRCLPGKRCKYLHISSAAVYGNPAELPIKETAATSPISPYGWHKLMSEELCKEYHSLYGLPVVIARPFSVYGAGMKKQLFWDIYKKWRSDNETIELWGTGEETRDFIHINDLVDCLERLLINADSRADIYNVANGEMVTVQSAADKMLKLLDSAKPLHFNDKIHEGNPRFWKADIERIMQIGYKPAISFEQGLKELCHWLKSL